MTGGLTKFHPSGASTRRRLGCVALIGLLVPTLAGAAQLAESDARAVRQVVEAQLKAFAADDAAQAFSYASASIQAQFGDADNFMAMVRSGYPMVVRPSSVSFFQPQIEVGTPATVTQRVQLRDREGRLWMVTYRLERQTSAGWRISGCVAAADGGKSSI
ncbi:MAG: DUF4864 domain-containing protein [Betaproteobacteria bacterium]|nr:DUF4864 domain-containing protein [Betaproteobacteria bacterium]